MRILSRIERFCSSRFSSLLILYDHPTNFLQMLYLSYTTVRLTAFKRFTYPIQLSDLPRSNTLLTLYNHPTCPYSNALLTLYNRPTYPLQMFYLSLFNFSTYPIQPSNLLPSNALLTLYNHLTYSLQTLYLMYTTVRLIPYNSRWLCQKCDIVDTTFHASCVPGPCTATQSALPTLRGKAGRQH